MKSKPWTKKEYKQYMITFIRQRWYYEEGRLEKMTFEKVNEIYERCIDYYAD